MALPRTLLSASQIDRKLPALRSAAQTLARAIPASGWIRVLRESLGITAASFGRRLRIAQQNVVKLEASERAGVAAPRRSRARCRLRIRHRPAQEPTPDDLHPRPRARAPAHRTGCALYAPRSPRAFRARAAGSG